MTEEESRQESMLRKIRGLLAKANATPFEGEADVFRKKADELMTQYAIEEWQLAQSSPDTGPTKPIRKDMDFSWCYNDELGEDALWPMFRAVADHCRCVIANLNVMGAGYDSTGQRKYVIPVYGSPTDISYMDMLFTNLMIQMSSKFKPQFDSSKSDGENIFNAKEAGMSWKDIAFWIGKPELVKYKADGETIASISGYLKSEYRKYANSTGREFHSANPKSYIRSFAIGYVNGVKELLKSMRSEQGQGSGSMALAIVDMKEKAKLAMWEEFANQAPGGYKGKGLSTARDTRKVDYGAMAKGGAEGRKANIVGKGDKTLGARKQLG